MAVSRARNVERSRWAWLSYPLPAALVAWLSNDVPACRGLAVAWLIRGARAPSGIPGIGRARHGRSPRSKTGRRVFPMVAVMIGIDPHKASHTAGGDRPGGSAAGPAAGTGLRRPGGAAAGVGA